MKNKTYILFMISISLFIVLSGVLYYGVTSILTLKNDESTLRGELDSWLKRSRDSSTLQENLTEAKKVREEMNNYLFVATEENQISFISEMESIIKRTGTKGEVKSLDVAADYSKMICSLTFSGSWADVYHTLLALEAYPIKINLDDVSVVEEKIMDIASKNDKVSSPLQQYRANVKFTITSMIKPK